MISVINFGVSQVNSKTVTVIYFLQDGLGRMCQQVFNNLQLDPMGRVKLPSGFNEGKLLVAVLDGQVDDITVNAEFYDGVSEVEYV
ncbi:DUF2375 domain-containing protein [Corallincola luteus]|uniref:DUF2375 domain-containing protein n=1 Tax=Corallincola luteus TaxID=1775177 RepID=A0ABY2AS66_9GAMM|nr:DUF2375 domain-containing protein [Corallincola luteus]